MYIKCKKCGHREEVKKELFVKIIGGAMPIGGFWAWVTYFVAGTGFALAICSAMVVGGVALLVFKDEIVEFLSERYSCPKCHSKSWEAEK